MGQLRVFIVLLLLVLTSRLSLPLMTHRCASATLSGNALYCYQLYAVYIDTRGSDMGQGWYGGWL